MRSNKPKMNNDKTEVLPITTVYKLPSIENTLLWVDSEIEPFSNKVKNLAVYIDSYLNMNVQVNDICKTAYFQIRKLWQLRALLETESIKTLCSAFVLSGLDYCNTLLSGSSNENIKHNSVLDNNTF